MNYIAVDTASGTLKVLVKYNDKYEFFSDESFKSASEKLMVKLDAALSKLGASLGDMDFFACVIGPGSFTGIRIGLATVKTFAYVYKKPVLPINSLELLASCCPADVTVATIDASNGMRYLAVYNEKVDEIMPPKVLLSEELDDFLSSIEEDHIVVADKVSSDSIKGAIVPTNTMEGLIRAVENNANRLCDGNLIEPIYIRKPQAVLDLEKRENK
ncbi:MAG: tRNA (adenosine(37)-N6)-threonylcarbamoyltransferase complex dimerization subunit type 1 TsaB [Clostridia bacterium]|nr:tRNA (adenosine(37)-N6)-threonylcarbamoyltransferase complex dimerization subunit type 1 TsaB [Clostridia bacterium]